MILDESVVEVDVLDLEGNFTATPRLGSNCSSRLVLGIRSIAHTCGKGLCEIP